MEEKKKEIVKVNVKTIAIVLGVILLVILGTIGTATVSYNVFKNNNAKVIKTSTGKEGVADTKVQNKTAYNEDELSVSVPEQEKNEEANQVDTEEKQEEKKVELTDEEKKKQEELRKKQQEEQKKRQEEEKKKQAARYPYWIKVNYTANTVTIYKQDENGNYTVPIKAMVCSTGAATPRSGVYKTQAKYAWKALIGSAGKYCTRITGQILFHSVPYLHGDINQFEYWEYDRLGTTRSLGCIRLTMIDAKWIYDNCAVGTSVEFYGSPAFPILGYPGFPNGPGFEDP